MNPTLEPVRTIPLPSPSEVHAHIGYLLRELHLARRLLKLSRDVHDERTRRQQNHSAPEAGNAR